MNKPILFKIGDLVKSQLYVGVGIVLDIIYPEALYSKDDDRSMDEPIAQVYWIFPDPIAGEDGWEHGMDYVYLGTLSHID